MTVSKRYVSSRFDVASLGPAKRVEVRISVEGDVTIADPTDLSSRFVIPVADWLRLAEAFRALEVKR